MAPPPSFLEYEEEDLFGSDDDSTAQSALLASLRTAKPIPSISLASSSLASSTARTRAQVPESDAEKRLAELRSRKSKPAEQNEGTGQGVNRLRSYCLTGE